jgi:hypothetical protein
MTHGCTLREDNEPCVCEAVAAKAGSGTTAPVHCAYRYDLANLDEAQAAELNQAYSTLRAEYAEAQANA